MVGVVGCGLDVGGLEFCEVCCEVWRKRFERSWAGEDGPFIFEQEGRKQTLDRRGNLRGDPRLLQNLDHPGSDEALSPPSLAHVMAACFLFAKGHIRDVSEGPTDMQGSLVDGCNVRNMRSSKVREAPGSNR